MTKAIAKLKMQLHGFAQWLVHLCISFMVV